MVGIKIKNKAYFNKDIFKYNDYELYKVIHNLFPCNIEPMLQQFVYFYYFILISYFQKTYKTTSLKPVYFDIRDILTFFHTKICEESFYVSLLVGSLQYL